MVKKLNPIKHYIYTIKDEYFEDFPDPNLKNNKGESRPNYFVFEDDNKEILWFIPLSSRIEKFIDNQKVDHVILLIYVMLVLENKLS